MAWGVDFTPEAKAWFAALPAGDRNRMARRIDQLRAHGPALGRPAVDSVNGSRHHNMKELRVKRSPVRALFAFGPDRRALILVGESKTGAETRWYRTHVNAADRLLADHLDTFRRESACRATRAGSRSAQRQA